jgi:hypothetical protein
MIRFVGDSKDLVTTVLLRTLAESFKSIEESLRTADKGRGICSN